MESNISPTSWRTFLLLFRDVLQHIFSLQSTRSAFFARYCDDSALLGEPFSHLQATADALFFLIPLQRPRWFNGVRFFAGAHQPGKTAATTTTKPRRIYIITHFGWVVKGKRKKISQCILGAESRATMSLRRVAAKSGLFSRTAANAVVSGLLLEARFSAYLALRWLALKAASLPLNSGLLSKCSRVACTSPPA